jgi:hypothetical protein
VNSDGKVGEVILAKRRNDHPIDEIGCVRVKGIQMLERHMK